MPPKKFIATICKQFTFDAAHSISTMPDGHKCRRKHGHTYRVDLVLRGEVDQRGFFIDYGELAEIWERRVHRVVDHTDLDHIIGMGEPTTENLAKYIINNLIDFVPTLDRVRVYESSSTYCEVSVMELRAAGIIPIPLARSLTREVAQIPEKP